MQEYTNEWQSEKERWFTYKAEVRNASWLQEFTQQQRELLALSPWHFISVIQKLVDKIALSQAKYMYYLEIANSNATPSQYIEMLRDNIHKLLQNA